MIFATEVFCPGKPSVFPVEITYTRQDFSDVHFCVLSIGVRSGKCRSKIVCKLSPGKAAYKVDIPGNPFFALKSTDLGKRPVFV